MGVVDTMCGYVECPHCNSIEPAYIQFKWLDPYGGSYHIGDYLNGSESYSILDSDSAICESCKKEYKFFAIGHFGTLYGFANEVQLEKIEEIFPIRDGKDTEIIKIVVSKGKLDNIEEFIENFRQQLLQNPEERVFYITDKKVDLNPYVCRISGKIRDLKNRPKVGDKRWLFSQKSIYQPWKYQNVLFTLVESQFNEKEQINYFTIEGDNGERLEHIPEYMLITDEKREQILQDIMKAEKQLIEYAKNPNGKRPFLSIHLRIHGRPMVERLKNEGKIPKDFTL